MASTVLTRLILLCRPCCTTSRLYSCSWASWPPSPRHCPTRTHPRCFAIAVVVVPPTPRSGPLCRATRVRAARRSCAAATGRARPKAAATPRASAATTAPCARSATPTLTTSRAARIFRKRSACWCDEGLRSTGLTRRNRRVGRGSSAHPLTSRAARRPNASLTVFFITLLFFSNTGRNGLRRVPG